MSMREVVEALVDAKSTLEESLTICQRTIDMCRAEDLSVEELAASDDVARFEARARAAAEKLGSIILGATAGDLPGTSSLESIPAYVPGLVPPAMADPRVQEADRWRAGILTQILGAGFEPASAERVERNKLLEHSMGDIAHALKLAEERGRKAAEFDGPSGGTDKREPAPESSAQLKDVRPWVLRCSECGYESGRGDALARRHEDWCSAERAKA